MSELQTISNEQLNQISTLAHFVSLKSHPQHQHIAEDEIQDFSYNHDAALNLSWMVIANLCQPTLTGLERIDTAYRTLRSVGYPLVTYDRLIDDLAIADAIDDD